MGDGVLAYFGYPLAHEDDAERAIHTGLGVVHEISDLNETVGNTFGVELGVRVGIATGPVVVGDLIGEGASQESAVVGETPNLAARLQALASRNAVVIGPGTHELVTGRFEFEDLGEHELKGFAKPVCAWRVIAPSRRQEPLRGDHTEPASPHSLAVNTKSDCCSSAGNKRRKAMARWCCCPVKPVSASRASPRRC